MTDTSSKQSETPPAVTVVLTSCGRFDLLEETLTSFFTHNDYPLHRVLIIEDSGRREVLDVTAKFPDQPIDVIINERNLGQMAAIDKAYAEVETEFIFHCEDDWEFLRPGVIADSVRLMTEFPEIAVVWPRGDEGAPPWVKRRAPTELDGIRYRWIDPRAHHVWGNFTFNPGLRRLSHYRTLPGGFVQGNEGDTSIAFKRMGLYMVTLQDVGVRHIGHGQSTAGPVLPPLQKLVAKARRLPKSQGRRLAHLIWKLTTPARPFPDQR